jgi:putative spermidine/putrescine transport system permease protein
VLTVALVLGEYTMATLDQYQTFPVWIVSFDQSNSAQTSVAASLAALVLTWLVLLVISMVGDRRRTARLLRRGE